MGVRNRTIRTQTAQERRTGGKQGNGPGQGANVAHKPNVAQQRGNSMQRNAGFLQESGDRWKLDTLIPDKDRAKTLERTSKLKVATKAVIVHGSLNPERATWCPIYSSHETGLEEQRRLRGGDIPLPGDRLL